MKLLGTDGSPYVRKVRISLEEKGVAYDYVRERPSVPGSSVPNYNPLAKIPTLVLDNGKAIYDSPVIVEYVDGIGKGAKLIPTEFEARIEVKRWEALGDGIADATVLVSHDFRNPENERQKPDWYEKHGSKITRGLATMDRDLGDREFCFGNSFTLADIACAYSLAYLDLAWKPVDWRKAHPRLAKFYERMMQRPSFQKTVPQV